MYTYIHRYIPTHIHKYIHTQKGFAKLQVTNIHVILTVNVFNEVYYF